MTKSRETSDQFHHVAWLFHATAMVHDYEAARDALSHLAGLRVLEDTAIDTPEVGRRGGMAWLGDNAIEIGQPFGPVSPITGFLDRFGPGLHSIGIQVRDLDATVDHLESHGVGIVAHSKEFRFVFCNPRDTAGLLLQFADVQMDFDPRFGADVPDVVLPDGFTQMLAPTALAFVAATMPNLTDNVGRLTDVIGTAPTFNTGSDTNMEAFGISLGDCTLVLEAAADSEAQQKAGWSRVALLVDSLQDAERVLHDRGWNSQLAPGPSGFGELLIDPRHTAAIPLSLVDRLLPGDPRLSDLSPDEDDA